MKASPTGEQIIRKRKRHMRTGVRHMREVYAGRKGRADGMKVSQRKVAVIVTYATQAVKILSVAFYTPVMLRILGQSEFGTYQLASSVVSYLGLFSLGFGSSYTRFYMRYAVKGDYEGIAALNGMFLMIFTILAFLAGLCGCVMIHNIYGLLGEGLTADEYRIAATLMKWMVFNLALSFISSVFDCVVTAHEEFIFQKTVLFLHTLLNPFITLPLLLAGFRSAGMAAAVTGLSVVKCVVTAHFCFQKLNVRFSFKKMRFSLLKEIWGFTFFIFLNQIIDQAAWNVDKFLLGRMSGTAAVAVYGLAGQLNSMYLEISGAVSGPFAPQINRMAADGADNSELSRLFIKVGRIQALLLFLAISGYIWFGKAFMILWGGPEYERSYAVGLFLMVPVTVALTQNLGIEIQRAKNKHRIRSVVYTIIAAGNVAVSIPLIRAFGATGAAMGTALSLIPGSILFMNLYYQYALGLDMKEFWRQMGTILLAGLPAFMAGFLIWKYADVASWSRLLSVILLYSALYCLCMYAWGMNQEEKGQTRSIMKKIKYIYKAGEKRL